MRIEDVRSIINMIRDAENKELIIVSLFLLPILLGVWSMFLNSLGLLDGHNGLKFLLIFLLLVVYSCGLISMKRNDTEQDRLKRARYHVETKLKKRGGKRASFDAIRNEVNKTYSNEFLEKLIDLNPNIFSTCIISVKEGNKPGITIR